MGIWEKPKEWLLEALVKEFGISSPRGDEAQKRARPFGSGAVSAWALPGGSD